VAKGDDEERPSPSTAGCLLFLILAVFRAHEWYDAWGRVGFVVRDLEPFAHCSSNIFLPHSSSARLPYTKFPPARCASFAIVSIGQPTLIWRAEDSSVIETDAWLTGGNYATWSRMSRRLASEFRGRTAT
jgi:hypothetical protein